MTPEEQAVIKAARKWAEHGPFEEEELDDLLFAAECLPPEPAIVERISREFRAAQVRGLGLRAPPLL